MTKTSKENTEEPTHYCEDCEEELVVMWVVDGHELGSRPIVCGDCGGTNTRELEVA